PPRRRLRPPAGPPAKAAWEARPAATHQGTAHRPAPPATTRTLARPTPTHPRRLPAPRFAQTPPPSCPPKAHLSRRSSAWPSTRSRTHTARYDQSSPSAHRRARAGQNTRELHDELPDASTSSWQSRLQKEGEPDVTLN